MLVIANNSNFLTFFKIVQNELEFFENSITENKPQVLLFSRHMYPPLLFLVVAFEYKSKVRFAYVYTKDRKTTKICKKYQISPDQPTVLVLKEEPSSPVAVARVCFIIILLF